MKSQKTFTPTLALLAVLATTSGLWSGAVHAQGTVQAQVQIYGAQLMSDAERTEYQAKMRSLKTVKERDDFRLQHHEKMKIRAADKGVTLPDTPQGSGPKDNASLGGGAATGGAAGAGAGKGGSMNSPAGSGSVGR